MTSSPIDRLLRSAACVPGGPRGGDALRIRHTRVLAQWRAGLAADPAAIVQMLRFMSRALNILASAGACSGMGHEDSTDEYALTDAAIGGVFDQ